MPWCPICKEEYREGFQFCGECGAELSETPQEEEQTEPFVFLCERSGYVEIEVTESLLRSFDIPFQTRKVGSDYVIGLYLGVMASGTVQFYVPKSDFDRANELLLSKTFEEEPGAE